LHQRPPEDKGADFSNWEGSPRGMPWSGGAISVKTPFTKPKKARSFGWDGKAPVGKPRKTKWGGLHEESGPRNLRLNFSFFKKQEACTGSEKPFDWQTAKRPMRNHAGDDQRTKQNTTGGGRTIRRKNGLVRPLGPAIRKRETVHRLRGGMKHWYIEHNRGHHAWGRVVQQKEEKLNPTPGQRESQVLNSGVAIGGGSCLLPVEMLQDGPVFKKKKAYPWGGGPKILILRHHPAGPSVHEEETFRIS